MEQFTIILKNDKIKSYRIIALILLLLNLSVFIFLLVYDAYRYKAASAILLIGIYIFMRLYFVKKYNQGHYLDEICLFVLAGCWMGLQNYILVALCILMGILYHLALQKIIFAFTIQKVSKINFPQKEFQWNMFSNVLLKDNILTMDFKNNRLIQAEIEKWQPVNEFQFNEFASAQLSGN